MDDVEAREFTLAMQAEYPDTVDTCDAFVTAMEAVHREDDPLRYFGMVAGGTFYSDTEFDRTRWFPDCGPAEARCLLTAEFGEAFTDDLSSY